MFQRSAISLYLIVAVSLAASAQQKNTLAVSEKQAGNAFTLFNSRLVSSFIIDSNDAKVVSIAANAFTNDIKLMSEKEMRVEYGGIKGRGCNIIAGTIGHSKFIDSLIETKKIDVSLIKNKWECFLIKVIDKNKLVIAGSDRRGTAFGIFQLSRMMGVSPFVWWADVTPQKKEQLFVSGNYISKEPSVKYRGIFINDEDWGLQPWAAKNIDTDIKDIGPKTYAKVFELLLRLKANYIWPAMHPCTKAFYYYKENPQVADDYAIVVGSSHAEPMLRNNVFEWAVNFKNEYGKQHGEWRYDVNKNEIYKYWNDRVAEAKNYESVFTVGMRGVHDSGMPGPKDPDKKVTLLENIISDQRDIFKNNFKKSPSTIPQIFIPYKEVLDLYRRNMKLPDDITIIWPDDNYGYIRQLPDEEEQKRSGGSGVYYHLSYWGWPQDYLWLSTTSPSLISWEMTKAYYKGAQRLWVFNMGDIKPAEMELQFAMDLAWDIKKQPPQRAYEYAKEWAREIFGKELAPSIASIKNEYYQLAAAAKPEHLGMVLFSKEQMNDRLNRYNQIASEAIILKASVPSRLQDAYYELILYPVVSAKLMNEKVFYTRLSDTKKAMIAYDSINLLTNVYNTTTAGGRWNGIMSDHPRDLKIFNAPLNADTIALLKDTLSNRKPIMVLNASDFSTNKEQPNNTISTINGLGINGKGLTVLPDHFHQWKQAIPLKDIYTTYEANLGKGAYIIIVKCVPGFSMGSSKQLRYGISINDEPEQVMNIYAETESNAWKQNVVNGFSYGTTTHVIKKDGSAIIKLSLKDPGLVISTIEIYKQ
ncbi:MAG: glycosyl hydrolase 115 family protein [Ginsengibacter sp.]